MKRIFIFIAMLLGLSTTGMAQNGGFNIIGCHPDIRIKVLRCEAYGTTCYIDFLLLNTSNSDIDLGLIGGNGYMAGEVSRAYDDEGNMYARDALSVGYDSRLDRRRMFQTLPSNIPRKARIQIEGVPTSVTTFLRIDLRVLSEALHWHVLDSATTRFIKFMNVPISREGDE